MWCLCASVRFDLIPATHPGFDASVGKPFTAEELLDTLQATLAGSGPSRNAKRDRQRVPVEASPERLSRSAPAATGLTGLVTEQMSEHIARYRSQGHPLPPIIT